MKTKKRWMGVAALVLVTVVALIAVIVIKNKLDKEPGNSIAITQAGTEMGIKRVQELTEDGTITGYLVNVESKGYGAEPMQLAISFNAAKDTVTGIEVISHTETEGFGASITEAEFLAQFDGATLPIVVPGISLESAKKEVVETAPVELGALIDGTYKVVADEASNGYTSQVTLTVTGGNITDVVWDCFDEEGKLKSIMSQNGEYVMIEGNPTWFEQAEALATYVVEHQGTTGLTMDEEGKIDAIASVSITITDFVNQVEEALLLASGAKKPVLADGTYEIVADEASNGYTSQVTLTVTGGNITDVAWDCFDEEGKLKSIMSQNGEYVMIEGNPTWFEQAEALAAYVVEHQGTTGLTMDEEGKIDAIASVSITITDFVNQVEEALLLASGAKKPVLADGTYEIVADEASNGYTSQVTLTVTGGNITDVAWDCFDEEGKLKSIMSQNGEYVMIEGNPTWFEQAEALAAYVIEKQGTTGLTMDEEGKIDVIASVSITITDFVNQVEEALLLAAGEEPTTEEPTTEEPTTTEGTQVDGISGATVTTKAFMKAINNAQEYLGSISK